MDKTNKRDYFTEQTEDAIILYNKTDDQIQKNVIYERYIHYSFYKLTQNLIHTFKFYQTDVDDLEHLQHEIIIFLLSKIHLFHQSQSIQDRLNKIINKTFLEEYNGDFNSYTGNAHKVSQQQINDFISELDVSDECMNVLKNLTPPKAYSYFGTAVKRWLILYTKKNYSNKLNFDNIDDFKEESNQEYVCDLEEEQYSEEKSELSVFIDQYIEFINSKIYVLFPKDNDVQIADAILELFRRREALDLNNKKKVYLYIREIVPPVIEEKLFDLRIKKEVEKYNKILENYVILEDKKICEVDNIISLKYLCNVSTPQISKVTQKLQRIFKHNYNFYLENDYISFKY